MIENKSQYKKLLKENKNIKLRRLFSFFDNDVKAGEIGTIETVQSNAWATKWTSRERASWSYFEDVEIKDNKIYYYSYVPKFKYSEELKEKYKKLGVELEELDSSHKINKESDYYGARFTIIINEIIE